MYCKRPCQPERSLRRVIAPLLLLLFCFSNAAQASRSIAVDDQLSVSLQPALFWFYDDTAQASIEQVSQRLDEFTFEPGKTGFARNTGAYWLYFELLATPGAAKRHWLLELDHSPLNQVDFFQRPGNSAWQIEHTGDTVPVSRQTIPHRLPLSEVHLDSERPTQLFVRVQSSTSIITPLTLWQQPAFARYNHKNQFISGIVYGIFFALIIYNLFLYPTVRDRAYLWFALYLGGFVFFQMAHQGYARLYLWPESPALADRAASVALWLCLAGGLRFTQFISRSHQLLPRLDRLFSTLVITSLILTLAVILFGPGPTFAVLPLFAGIVALLIPVPLFVAWRAHYRPARYALMAFFPILPGAVLLSARAASLIEPSFWTEQFLALGTAVSSLLLSFALADRINLLREEKQRVQQDLLNAEQSANQARQQFTRRLLDAQDDERRRIATELHDGVGQNLSWLVNTLKKQFKASNESGLGEAHQVAQETVREIRQLSHQLHPYILDQLGLEAAIESVAERIETQSKIRIKLEIDEHVSLLKPEIQLHIYRIVQEALHNASRHSKASIINLSLKQAGNVLQLDISDDGIGLDHQGATNGLGLESMRQRVELLSGEITFHPGSPQGLLISIRLPLETDR